MCRVLVGDFGPIARAGMRDFLAEQGLRPIGDEGSGNVLAQVAELYPDAVVIDMDREDSVGMAAALAGRYPGVTIVACSVERPVMRVRPAWGREPYSAILSGLALAEAAGRGR
jgi:AmiR/NasT family two-component response regulator